MKIKERRQNKISHLFLGGSDLLQREKEVLEDASRRTGFVPKKLIDQSSWWSSEEIGAFRYKGEYKGKPAVIKIQGVKPDTSEIYMINAFQESNRSKILRPPILFTSLPWDDEKRYEALILEFVEGKNIVNSPTDEEELREFFALREEYKRNCAVKPWIDIPKESLSEEVRINFTKWREVSFRLYPSHPLRDKRDEKLIENAVNLLSGGYQGVKPEFQHGHFSVNDLYKKETGEVVVLSNLYWSWKPPFYDAVFGLHWYIYNLAQLSDVNPQLVESQRNLWLSKINSLVKTREDERLVWMALLERATAGINLDSLSVDYKNPISKYLVDSTRRQVGEYMRKLS